MIYIELKKWGETQQMVTLIFFLLEILLLNVVVRCYSCFNYFHYFFLNFELAQEIGITSIKHYSMFDFVLLILFNNYEM